MRVTSEIDNTPSPIFNPQSPIPNWKVVAASVVGVSHAKTGQPCQDAHASRLLPNGVLIAAVADGAGSAALAEVGAQIAVRVGVETLAQIVAHVPGGENRFVSPHETEWRDALWKTLEAARAALDAEAAAREVPVRELATTLILAVASPSQLGVIQVGDGALVALDEHGGIFAVTTPPDAEYANATTFLTSPDALATAQIVFVAKAVTSLALFSDGLQRLALKLPEGTPHAPFFTPLFRFIGEMDNETDGMEQLATFLRSPRIVERADDDLTLLLATRQGTGDITVLLTDKRL